MISEAKEYEQREANYRMWKRKWDARHLRAFRRFKRTVARIYKTLARGGVVVEDAGWMVVEWSLTMPSPAFIPEAMNTEYLTRHLASRHDGFGTELQFEEAA